MKSNETRTWRRFVGISLGILLLGGSVVVVAQPKKEATPTGPPAAAAGAPATPNAQQHLHNGPAGSDPGTQGRDGHGGDMMGGGRGMGMTGGQGQGQGQGQGMMGGGMMGGGMMGGMGMMGGLCPLMGGAGSKVEVKKVPKGLTITITAEDARAISRIQKMGEAMRLMHEAASE